MFVFLPKKAEAKILNDAERVLANHPPKTHYWNGYKVATIVLGASSALAAIAALVTALFFSPWFAITCTGISLTLLLSSILVGRIQPTAKLYDLIKKLSVKVTELYQKIEDQKIQPKTQRLALNQEPVPPIEPAQEEDQRGPTTAEVQQQIDELNAEIQLQQGKNVNIPLVVSLQTVKNTYEILLNTCEERDQLEQQLDMLLQNSK